jgi:hypothetical protein
MGAWFANQIVGWLMTIVFDGLDILWKLLSTSFLVSPDVTVLPQVTTIMDTSLIVVNTCYGLAIIVAGVTVMAGGTVQIRYTVADLLPRLVVGFIAANFARPLCSGMVSLANALTQALTGDTVNAKDPYSQILDILGGAAKNAGANGLLLVIIGLVLAVLTGMLLCAWIVRLGVLIALVGLAPVALACHGLPWPALHRSGRPAVVAGHARLPRRGHPPGVRLAHRFADLPGPGGEPPHPWPAH